MSYQDFTLEQKAEADRKLNELEPLIIKNQFAFAVQRLQKVFDERLSSSPEAGRYLIQQVHLIVGNRRKVAQGGGRRSDPVNPFSIDCEKKGA